MWGQQNQQQQAPWVGASYQPTDLASNLVNIGQVNRLMQLAQRGNGAATSATPQQENALGGIDPQAMQRLMLLRGLFGAGGPGIFGFGG